MQQQGQQRQVVLLHRGHDIVMHRSLAGHHKGSRGHRGSKKKQRESRCSSSANSDKLFSYIEVTIWSFIEVKLTIIRVAGIIDVIKETERERPPHHQD